MPRDGVVLVFVLLAIVVLELLAVSALGFARLAHAGSRTTLHVMTLRLAAEQTAGAVAATLDAVAAAEHPVGFLLHATPPAPPGIQISATVETLVDGYQLVRARAVPIRGGAVEAALLVRVLTPDVIRSAFAATINAHEDLPQGGVVVETEPCADAVSAPLITPARRILEPHDTLPLGPRTGVSWTDVQRIADALGPDGESGARLIHLPGPLTLSVPLHGIVVVDGDLTIAAGGAVHGLLAVRGTLMLLDDAAVNGAVRARRIAAGADEIRPDRCAIARAMDAPALRRVYRPGPRWRLPAF